MTSRDDYEAAKKRVERFRGAGLAWLIYNVSPDTSDAMDRLRADLNLIARYEGDSIERVMEGPPKGTVRTHLAPAISARLYMVGCALTGLLTSAENDQDYAPAVAVRLADMALKEMGE